MWEAVGFRARFRASLSNNELTQTKNNRPKFTCELSPSLVKLLSAGEL